VANSNTFFYPMLKFIPRHQFDTLESRRSTGRKSRNFIRWIQFVHLMFMQLTVRASLLDGIQSRNLRAKNFNHLGAKPVSRCNFVDIYRKRWQIEIIFRWIKKKIKIKTFIGNSHNAVMTQIYAALIAYLLLCMVKYFSTVFAILQNLLKVRQVNNGTTEA